MKHTKRLSLATLALGISLALFPVGLASASTINLTPSSSSVSKGSLVRVNIYENSGGDAVNAARATLSYPANLLDYVSISNSAAFSIVAASGGGGGSVQVERGALPAVTGRQLLATVTFRAKTDAGSAPITVTGGSVLSEASNGETLTGSSGTNLTLTPVPPTAEVPPPDTTPPTITKIKVVNIGPNSATITWTTSEPANSKVSYGFNTNYGVEAVDNAQVTDHKITLNPNLLKPMTEVHFLVSSTDGAGNAATDKDQTFTTKGLTVKVTLVDQRKQPIEGAVIDLGDKPVTTNKKGQATVTNLAAGKLKGTVTYKGEVKTITVTVNETVKDTLVSVQSATIGIKVKHASSVLPAVILAVALLLLGGSGFGAPYLRKYLHKGKDNQPTPPAATPPTDISRIIAG
jgi:hypothetical protein